MENKDRRIHDVETRIKKLQGKKLTKEDKKIYCYLCGREIKTWEFLIPFKIKHSIMGWSHIGCWYYSSCG